MEAVQVVDQLGFVCGRHVLKSYADTAVSGRAYLLEHFRFKLEVFADGG